MRKSDPAASKKERAKTVRWVVSIFGITILISGSISLVSDVIMESSGIFVAFAILLAIVLLANFDKVEFPELWEQDMAAATEKILLECVHLDMSGTWLGISPVAERMENVCKIFALPENIVPFAITAIGYPLQKTSMDRDFDFSIVHYNEFKKA